LNLVATSEITPAIRKWQTYCAYKDVGDWLTRIPVDWKSLRFKQVAQLMYGDSLPNDGREEGDIPVYGSNGVVGYHSQANTLAPALIVGRKGSYGKVNFSEHPAYAIDTTYYIDRRTTEADLRWLYYTVVVLALDAYSEDSAIPGLSRDYVYSRLLPVPSIDEQGAIAAFLDHETAKIDALVAKKGRLIELLQEKRAALITHAVTKGLDPNVPMKGSDIEWLGEIPAQWTVIRMRHACSDIFLGLTSRVDYVGDGGFPLVRAVNISDGILDFSETRYISEEQHRDLTKYHRPKLNDVLLSKSGSIGTAALVETAQEFSIYESIFALRGRPELLKPKFLLYLVRSDICQRQYSASSVGMGVGHLNMSDIVNVRVALPTLSEQCAIAEYLDRETGKIDKMVAKVEEAIERLKEYRTALITAAVTGKIDVRDAELRE
jgi:type I restriction enzyme S subunit